jgi:hypothetical protein
MPYVTSTRSRRGTKHDGSPRIRPVMLANFPGPSDREADALTLRHWWDIRRMTAGRASQAV